MTPTGERSTRTTQEIKWNLICWRMGLPIYHNLGTFKHCIVIGKKLKVIKNLNHLIVNRHLKNFTKNGVSMKTYRIEEEITNGWAELHTNLTRDEAATRLNELIEQGYNPNRLRVRTLLNE
tara:strand:+ start:60 stop:422 length:363 start_codon:yes stop_codon:yes gene_type:complete